MIAPPLACASAGVVAAHVRLHADLTDAPELPAELDIAEEVEVGRVEHWSRRLLGQGDMLFQAPDAAAPVRLQGTFVSDPEIQRLVTYWRGQAGNLEAASMATGGVVDSLPAGVPLKQIPLFEEAEEDLDPLFDEAVDLVRRQGRASISMLQRRLRIGYTRSARLIETMQDKGIVGPSQPGTQGLEVLDYGPAAPPVGED